MNEVDDERLLLQSGKRPAGLGEQASCKGNVHFALVADDMAAHGINVPLK